MLVFIAITAFFACGVSYSLYQSHKENSQTEERDAMEMDLNLPQGISNLEDQKEV